MDSSAPKSIDGQDIQQRQATNSAGGIVEEAARTLHPAAAVFRDEILGNVGDRNKTLEANNARFRNLANLIQDVELSFCTRSSRRGEEDNVTYIEHHETFNVTQNLSRGSVKTLNNEERLVLPIDDVPAHPVEDSGAIGCVKLYMAGGVSFGSFPEACFFVHDAAKKSVREDGSVLLFLHLSKEIVIKGKLHSSQMTNEAFIEHVEHPHFMSCLTLLGGGTGLFDGEGEYRKGIVFMPLSISIQVTPWLKKALTLVYQVSSTGGSEADVELESEDELCRLVVEALGDSEHKELFDEYVSLKHENQALSELRSLMFGVSVSHGRGSFTVTLDEGKRSGNLWYINLGNDDRSMIPVSELYRMEVTVLGMQLRLCNGPELTHVSSLVDRSEGGWALWPMNFQPCSSCLKVSLVVMFNWAELTREEGRDILDNFSSKMSNALGLQGNNPDPAHETDVDAFPQTFKATVIGICCDLPLAAYRLKRAGLWEEEDSSYERSDE